LRASSGLSAAAFSDRFDLVMSTHTQRFTGPLEVKPLHRGKTRSEESSPRSDPREITQAKAGMGAVIKEAIGPDKLEAYGHASLMSGICSGEKVPEYLAAIYANEESKLRMAKALLRSSGKQVRERTVFEIEERTA
jgi:hypothetical protein